MTSKTDGAKPRLPSLANPLENLRHQEVLVRAMGLEYRGILQGSDEATLYLKTSLRYLSLPMDRVSALRPAEQEENLNKIKDIDPDFYLDPDFDGEPDAGQAEVNPEPKTQP